MAPTLRDFVYRPVRSTKQALGWDQDELSRQVRKGKLVSPTPVTRQPLRGQVPSITPWQHVVGNAEAIGKNLRFAIPNTRDALKYRKYGVDRFNQIGQVKNQKALKGMDYTISGLSGVTQGAGMFGLSELYGDKVANFTGQKNYARYQPATRGGNISQFVGNIGGWALGPGKVFSGAAGGVLSRAGKYVPAVSRLNNPIGRTLIGEGIESGVTAPLTAAAYDESVPKAFARDYIMGVGSAGVFGGAGKGLKLVGKYLEDKGAVKFATKEFENVVGNKWRDTDGKKLFSGKPKKLQVEYDPALQPKEATGKIVEQGKGKKKKRYWQSGTTMQLVHDSAKAAMEHKKSYGMKAAEMTIKEVKDGKQRGYIIVPKNYQFDGTESFAGIGAVAGIEPYQDEDGKMKFRYNKEKGMMGVGALLGGSKAAKFAGANKFSNLLDQKPRFEIDDSGAKLEEIGPNLFNKLKDGGVKLAEVLDHQDLFKNYPELKSTRVTIGNKSIGDASYDPKTNTINISDPKNWEGKGRTYILHEIQHAIQEIEGFARGGFLRGGSIDKYHELVDEYNRLSSPGVMFDSDGYARKGVTEKIMEVEDKINEMFLTDPVLKKIKKIGDINWKRDGLPSFEIYKRVAGELEARAVERRMDMPADQRGKIDPYAAEAKATTGTTNPDDFITRFDGGVSNSVNPKALKLSDLPKPEKLGDAEAGFKAVGDVIKDKIDRTKLSGLQLSKTNAELQANQKLLPENVTTPDVKTPSLTRSDALERAGVQDGGGSVLDKLSADFKAGRKLREKIGKVSTKDWIQSHLLDRFQPAKKYDENFFKNMRLLAGGGKARTEQIITENIGPALQRHRDRLEGLSQFMAIERMNELVNIRGLKRSLSDTEIAKGRQELLDRYGPEVVAEFDQSAKEIRTFMSKTLDAAVQSGLISKEAAEAAKTKNQMYVTFETLGQLARQDGDNPNFSSASFNTAKQNVLKQIGDSETGIADPLESTLAKVMNTISELDKNSIVRDFVENADENVVIPLRQAEKVKGRIKLYSEIKELIPVRNKVKKMLSTRNKWLNKLNTEIARLEKEGLETSLKQEPSLNTPTKVTRRTGQKTKAGNDRAVIYTKYPTTKQLVENLINLPSSEIKRIKGKIDTREKGVISLLDEIAGLSDEFENIKTSIVDKRIQAGELRDIPNAPLGMGTINVFRDGIKEEYAVPKELEIAVKNLDDSGFHWVVKMLNYPVRALKTGAVVINPEFFAVNPIRDLQDALFGEASVGGIKQSGKILGNYSKAIAETSGMGKEWEAWRKAGGGNSTFLNQEVRKSPQKTVKDLANQNRPRFMGTKKPSEILDWISRTSEESTRMSKFRTDVGSQKNKAGEVIPFAQVDKKLRDAAFASREITLDFAKMGSASRVLNQLIPFFNVSLIGTEKFFKLAKDNPANFAKAMTVYAGVPAVSLYLWNSQFKDFKDMRDFEKESNLVFMTGERSEQEKADNAPIKAFTLPMGNLSQPFFQTVNSLMSFAAKRDPSKLASLGADLIEGWSPVGFPVSEDRTRRFLSNVTPQALKTPIENFSNKNLYTGFDIEPNYINGVPREDVPAQYRDSKYTGPTAKAIGRVTGQLPGILQMSPAQVQNAVGTNFGGAGKTLMTGTDALLGTPPKDVSQVPFIKRFYGPSGGQIRSEEWEQASKEKQKTIKGMFKGTPIRDNAVMAAEESIAGDSEAVKKISDKIKYRPESVSPEEYYTYYMRDISPEPGKNRYEEEIRQDEIFSRLNTIEKSDNLDDASKFRLQTSLLETAGVPRGAYDYYKVAKQDNTRKTMYVLDQVDRFQSRDQLIRYLASGRAKIRNSQVVTQGVLTNLRDDGIISDAEYKQLNALKSTSDGKVFLPASKKKGKALVTDSQYRNKQASYIKKLGSTSPNYAKYGTIGSSGRNNLSSGRYSLM